MRGTIFGVLLTVLTGCLSSIGGNSNSALAAFHQQQRQEIDKQQQLSIDRPVNDNETQKTIPKQLANSQLPANGTQVITASKSAGSSSGQQGLSNGSKQRVPTTNSGGGGQSIVADFRQRPQSHHPTSSAYLAYSTPAAAPQGAAATSTTTTTSSLIPSSTTSLSTTTLATALTDAAASTISSVRAAPPEELGLMKHQQSANQFKRTSPQYNQRIDKAPQAHNQWDSNDINEPRATTSSASSKPSRNANNKQHEQHQQQQSGTLIDRMSTSRSYSYTEPTSNRQQYQRAEEDRHQQTVNQKQKESAGGGSSRWTHFGARLKPLSGGSSSGDHYETATSNSKTQTYQRQQQLQQQQLHLHHSQPQNHYQQAAAPSVRTAPAPNPTSTNQVNETDDDDNDDDQISEALLYKMLQQQNFLPNSNWRQPEETTTLGTGSGGGQSTGGGQTTDSVAVGRPTSDAHRSQQLSDSSRRMIKLLESYSHIHQVDDSDDQIRGSGTRLASRRPLIQASSSQSKQANYQLRANHQSNRPQQPPPNMARAPQYADRDHHRRQDPEDNSSHNYIGRPAAGDDSSAANQDGAEAPPGAESGADEFECPNNGIFADEASNCQAYHVCQSGAQVQEKFQCPLGTLFNNLILTCDFAHNVQCGKTKPPQPDASASGRPGDQDTLYRQPAVARNTAAQAASSQLQTATRRQQQQQHQAAPKQHQQQASSGPRQLTIGQKYNQPPNVITNVYTKPPANDAGFEESSNSNDEADDEPLAPLVPATLPPARVQMAPNPAATQLQLPYNAPPTRSTSAQSHQFFHQSAHRSQYPSSSNNNNMRPRMLSAENAAGATSATHVNRDETRDSSSAAQLAGSQPHHFASDTSDQSGGQSYNLVINHVTQARPTSGSQQQQHFAPSQKQSPVGSSGKQVAVVTADNNSNFVGFDTQPQKHSQAPKLYPQEQQQQHGFSHTHNKIRHEQIRPAELGNNNKQLGSGGLAQKQQQQQIRPRSGITMSAASGGPNNHNNKQRNAETERLQNLKQSMQFKSAYANEMRQLQQQQSVALATQQQQQLAALMDPRVKQLLQQQLAPLIDLTNDKSRASISSEALNDGLLLMLRHGATDQEPIARRMAAKARRGAGSSSQAIVVAPALINPNSPIDATLFPNVQRLLNNQFPALPGHSMDSIVPSTAATQHSQTIRQAPPSPPPASPAPNRAAAANTTRAASDVAAASTTPVSAAISTQQQSRPQNRTVVDVQQQQQQQLRLQQTDKIQQTEKPEVQKTQQQQREPDGSQKQLKQPKLTKRVKRLKAASQAPAASKPQERGATEPVSTAGSTRAGADAKEELAKKQSRRLKWPTGANESVTMAKNKSNKVTTAAGTDRPQQDKPQA